MEQMIRKEIQGLPIPASGIFLGTATGPLLAGENADALLDGAAERGVNAFDCARSYGHAEEVLGDWIKRRGNRNELLVLSKCGDIREGVVKVNARVIQEQLEQSLEALQMDTIDLYLLHRDDPDTPVGEMIETLKKLSSVKDEDSFGGSLFTVNDPLGIGKPGQSFWHYDMQIRPHDRDLKKCEIFTTNIIEDYFLTESGEPRDPGPVYRNIC